MSERENRRASPAGSALPSPLVPHPSLPSPWAEAVDPDLAALRPWTDDPEPPVIWSVAGTDSGGGAGLSADTRAAAAMGVHLCPVVAAVTAQHSQGGFKLSLKRLPDVPVVEVDEKTLDRYVGKYDYPGLGVLTVRRDGSKLLAQMTGQPEFELFAKAPDEFFWKVVSAEIKFLADDDGKIEKAVHKQGGATLEVKKTE